jgi:hypothetical protein
MFRKSGLRFSDQNMRHSSEVRRDHTRPVWPGEAGITPQGAARGRIANACQANSPLIGMAAWLSGNTCVASTFSSTRR